MIAIPCVSCYFISAYYFINTVGYRLYNFAPAAYLFALTFPDPEPEGCSVRSRRGTALLMAGLTVLTIVCIGYFTTYRWAYIYRDSPADELTERVDCGVYKGMYTSAERETCLENFENVVDRYIKDEDLVLYTESMPAGYMMTGATGYAPTPWDPTSFRYGGTEMVWLDHFFAHYGHFPTKIVYVQSEPEATSIESDTALTDFTKTHYHLIYSDNAPQLKAYIYELNR